MAAIPEVRAIKNISEEVISSEHKIIFAQASCKVKQSLIKKFYASYNSLLRENKELAAQITGTKRRIDKLRDSLESSYTLKKALDDNNTYLRKALLEKEHENKLIQKTSNAAIKNFEHKWAEYHKIYENAPLAIQRKKMKTDLLVSEFNLMKSKVDEQYLKRAVNKLKDIQNQKMQQFIISFARNMVKHQENVKIISKLQNKIKNVTKIVKDLEAEKIKVLNYDTNHQATRYMCERSINPENIFQQQGVFGGILSSNLPVLSFAGSLNIPVLQLPQDQPKTAVIEHEELLKNVDDSCIHSDASEYTNIKENQMDVLNRNSIKHLSHGQEIMSCREKKTDREIKEVPSEIGLHGKNKNSLSITEINDKNKPTSMYISNCSVTESAHIPQNVGKQQKVTILEDIVLNPEETKNLINSFYKKDAKQGLNENVLNPLFLHKSISDVQVLEENQTEICESTQHLVDSEKPTNDLHENFIAKYQMNKSPVFVYAPNKNLPTRKEDNINGQSIFFSKNETTVFSQNKCAVDANGLIKYCNPGGSNLTTTKNDNEQKEVVKRTDVNTSEQQIDTNDKNVVSEINETVEDIPIKIHIDKDSLMVEKMAQESRSDINFDLSTTTVNENNNKCLSESFNLQQNLATQANSYYPSSCFSLNEVMPSYGSPSDSEYGDDSLQDYSGLIDPSKKITTQTVDYPVVTQKDAQPVELSEEKQKGDKSTYRFGMGAFSSNPFKMFADNNKQKNDMEEIEKPDSTLKFLFNRGENSKKGTFFNFSK